jgi:hypothetical protein
MGREVFENTKLSLEQRCGIVEGDGATVENLLKDQAKNADSRVNILQTTARAALIGSAAFVKKFQQLLPRFNLSALDAFLEAENLWQDGLTLEFKTCYNVGLIEGFENRYEKQPQYLFKKPGPGLIAVVILGRCEASLAEQCKAALERISNKPAFKDAGITLYLYNEVQKRILYAYKIPICRFLLYMTQLIIVETFADFKGICFRET